MTGQSFLFPNCFSALNSVRQTSGTLDWLPSLVSFCHWPCSRPRLCHWPLADLLICFIYAVCQPHALLRFCCQPYDRPPEFVCLHRWHRGLPPPMARKTTRTMTVWVPVHPCFVCSVLVPQSGPPQLRTGPFTILVGDLNCDRLCSMFDDIKVHYLVLNLMQINKSLTHRNPTSPAKSSLFDLFFNKYTT